jgi:hypothetical protein
MKEIREGIYLWNLGYDNFLGYMAGLLGLNNPEKFFQ